jgi:hypothetical protein
MQMARQQCDTHPLFYAAQKWALNPGFLMRDPGFKTGLGHRSVTLGPKEHTQSFFFFRACQNMQKHLM